MVGRTSRDSASTGATRAEDASCSGAEGRAKPSRRQSYADFGVKRSIEQVRGLRRDHPADSGALTYLQGWIERDVARIEQQLGGELVGRRIIEIGPGQGLERAHYLGLNNEVESLDLDMTAHGIDLPAWWAIFRYNGAGRLVKTVGREALVSRKMRRRWVEQVGGDEFLYPRRHHGDICEWVNDGELFDVAVSWSVFEHVADPRQALLGTMAMVRPGGVVMVSIHNYTSWNGHHDIRSFSGSTDPRLQWGHLRPSTSSFVKPSAYLNEWRLDDWRSLFDELLPGHVEHAEYSAEPEPERALDGPIGDELREFDRDELLTVNLAIVGRRPESLPV